MPKPTVDILLIALTSPIKVGIYKNNNLIEEIVEERQASDSLAIIFEKLLEKYQITHIIYARGPGSFMAIKMAYVLIKTLAITKNITLLAQDGFFFNNNTPIKANGKRYFVKNGVSIDLELLETPEIAPFLLPQTINLKDFSRDVDPLYILPAV